MMPFSINLHGRLISYERPAVMGIVNITPDSFYAPSRVLEGEGIVARAQQLVADGADMLDLGACSTRPGSEPPTVATEVERIVTAVKAIRDAGIAVPLSIDTYRAEVARRAIECGADIINDISGGTLDPEMFDAVASLRVPYILMHMRGTPANMNSHTDYGTDVAAAVIAELSEPLARLEEAGVADIIIDPGFGFAKTLEQNYRLLAALEAFGRLGRPLLVGVSRKSMITRLLGIDAADAEVPTAIVGALALERGADILRVHDVAPAVQSIKILQALKSQS